MEIEMKVMVEFGLRCYWLWLYFIFGYLKPHLSLRAWPAIWDSESSSEWRKKSSSEWRFL